MHNQKNLSHAVAVVFMLVLTVLNVSCGLGEKPASVEYRNNEVSYADGESCVERYLLYEETGEYERYIAGMYFGNEVPGIMFGTCFETGTYATESGGDTEDGTEPGSFKITFSPKKQYSFESERLEYLGLENQIPYTGTLTETKLTITWRIWKNYTHYDVPIIYTRKE